MSDDTAEEDRILGLLERWDDLERAGNFRSRSSPPTVPIGARIEAADRGPEGHKLLERSAARPIATTT